MPSTAALLYTAAELIATSGLWAGAGFAAPLGSQISPEAAIYQAAAGHLPYTFSLPAPEAVAAARQMIEGRPDVMAAIRALAAHIDVNHPGVVPDDPIEALAGWARWPHMTTAEVVGRILAVAALHVPVPRAAA